MNTYEDEFDIERTSLTVFSLLYSRRHIDDFGSVSKRFRQSLRHCGGDSYDLVVDLVSFKDGSVRRSAEAGLTWINDALSGHRYLRPVELLCLASAMFNHIRSSVLVIPGFGAGVTHEEMNQQSDPTLRMPKIFDLGSHVEMPSRRFRFATALCTDVDLESFEEGVIDSDFARALARPGA